MSDNRVSLGEVSLALAWNVRGNPAHSSFVSEAEHLLGLPLPLQSNTSTRCDGKTLLWLGPRSWLLVAGPALPHDAFEVTRVALNAAGGALFDVSSSYVGWMIAGAGAARALNKRYPLDLQPRAFPAGHCAQSMLGHVNALLYKVDERPAFIVMTARSFAVEASRDLYASADTDGYRVVPATPFNAGTRAID